MNFHELSSEQRQRTIFRLTALWALNECGLGGLLHAFNVPFSGLALAGIALTLITLLYIYAQNNKLVFINALIVVLLIKAILSPHSSLTAYLAVSFQGVFAWLMYRLMGVNLFSIMIVCVISFIETASQKIFTLTLIGGMPFWNAIDVFINNISKQLFAMPVKNGALWAAGTYFGLYISFAFVLTFYIWNLIKTVKSFKFNAYVSFSDGIRGDSDHDNNSPRRNLNYLRIVFIISIIVLVLFSFYLESNQEKILFYLLRTMAVVCIWYFIFMPFGVKIFRTYLFKKLPKFQHEIDRIIELFPKLKFILVQSWKNSSAHKGLRRIHYFLTISLIEILAFE